MITLTREGPPRFSWCIATADKVLAEMRERGGAHVDMPRGAIGAYVYPADGSDLRAWLPWDQRMCPVHNAEETLQLFRDAGIPVATCGLDAPARPVPPGLAEYQARTAAFLARGRNAAGQLLDRPGAPAEPPGDGIRLTGTPSATTAGEYLARVEPERPAPKPQAVPLGQLDLFG